MVGLVTAIDNEESSSRAVRFLFAARWKIGEWLGWDDEDDGLRQRVPSLRATLPDELAGTVDPGRFRALPFTPLYELPDEFAAEIANKTMHGVMHLGAVPAEDGRVTVRMTVLVKTNGLFGPTWPPSGRSVTRSCSRPCSETWSAAGRRPNGSRSAVCDLGQQVDLLGISD